MNRKELIGALATKTGGTKAVADRNIAAASKAPAFKAGYSQCSYERRQEVSVKTEF